MAGSKPAAAYILPNTEARTKARNPQTMQQPPSKDPLHGITLEHILKALVEHYGWEELGFLIDIRCFNLDPSIKSSLTFLRKTPWARTKVEGLYLDTFHS